MADNVGFLVVHGIGAQEPGETLSKLLAGFRRFDRTSVPDKVADDAVVTVDGQRIRLYEVYWADLLKGDITRGAFRMNELQSIAWFPWFNFWKGGYGARRYSLLRLAWWWIALPIINFFLLFGYYGAGFFAQVLGGAKGKRPQAGDEGALSVAGRKIFGHGTTLTNVDLVLDEYLGDVFSYVNSAAGVTYRELQEPPAPHEVEQVYKSIVYRFYDQLVRAHADGCTKIRIVAHSLGTVVAYHALLGFGFEADRRHDAEAVKAAIAQVDHIYTIGCPLEKIRFFWPRLAPGGVALTQRGLRWDNFSSWFDPVAGTIRNFAEFGEVFNHRLLGGGFIRGHVVYEHSPVFLGALIRGLCGRDLPLKRSPGEGFRDWLLLLGETLLAPTLLVVILAVGAALFAFTAMLIPYLLSLGMRLFLAVETWAPIVDTASFTVLGAMVLAFLAGPLIRAKRVHPAYLASASRGSSQFEAADPGKAGGPTATP